MNEPPVPPASAIRDLPSAVGREAEFRQALSGRRPAVFLDYDGTLTPIVNDPAAATLPQATRSAIVRLKDLCPVAVVSGRDLADVQALVGIDGIAFAGSHGFDVVAPDGRVERRGEPFVPSLDRAEAALRRDLAAIPGAAVERKRYAVAVHFRRVPPGREDEVEAVVAAVAEQAADLRRTGGKKVWELRPDVPWDKGRAVLWLLEALGLDGDDVVPLYVGDDVTDEDAFRALAGRGIGVVVQGEDDARLSHARWSLPDPASARAFLDQLADLIEELSGL